MGHITSLFVRKVISVVDDTVDKDGLLRSVEIDPKSPIDPSHMVSDNKYYALLERIAALDNNATTLPLRVGAAMQCDDYGAFGLAWKSATNLRGSYERAERYARVLTSVSTHEIEITRDGAFMHLHRYGERSLGLRLSNEATMASIASISQQVATQTFKPLAVYFKHTTPKSIADHEAYFGCPVYFESERDALLVSHDTLQIPNKLGDESISTFFDAHLETELMKLKDNQSLTQRVRRHIYNALSEGVPKISDIANHFGMSGRTLQRRLASQGYAYQTLVDESRHQLAKRLLHQTNYTLAEVAFLTGFSEQSAFTRAFRRWAGQTPRAFRIDSDSNPR